MAKRSTVLWRLVVLGLFVAVVPVGIYVYDLHNEVDTEAMLDVSVSIRAISHVRIDQFGDSVWESTSGSGFLASSERCEVWTNHHVVADAAAIEVFPRGWDRATGIPATVVNSTPHSDIAVLRMERCDGMRDARLGDSDRVHVGDETYAVGNPLGHNPDSISRGIISHTARYKTGTIPYLQTDAAINPGNSGGALFNREGEVIGINSAIATTRSGVNVGIGFAVPINLAEAVVAELRRGPPSWGDAGIAEIIASLTPDEADVFRVPDGHGAIVLTDTPTEGPSAGKLFAHDVIFKINGIGLTGASDAARLISSHKPGQTLDLDLIRAGRTRSVSIILAEGWEAEEAPVPDYYDGYLGMTLEMWNGEDGTRGDFENPVITKVHSLGPAHKAQISSSQNALGMRGPFVVPYLLDAKIVAGVALEGEYHPIESVQELEELAALAYDAGVPLLLEVELWTRPNPRDVEAALERAGTAFYKVMPARTTGAKPVPDEAAAGVASSERTPPARPRAENGSAAFRGAAEG